MKWKEQLAVQSSVSALYFPVPVGTCKCAWTNVNRETVCGIQKQRPSLVTRQDHHTPVFLTPFGVFRKAGVFDTGQRMTRKRGQKDIVPHLFPASS